MFLSALTTIENEHAFLSECGFGSMMVDGSCVGVGAPTEENPNPFKPHTATSTINPMLILAAAAAFFFAG